MTLLNICSCRFKQSIVDKIINTIDEMYRIGDRPTTIYLGYHEIIQVKQLCYPMTRDVNLYGKVNFIRGLRLYRVCEKDHFRIV